MRKYVMFMILVPMFLMGCASAGLGPKPEQNVLFPNPKTITVIVPNDKAINASKVTQLDFEKFISGVDYRREKLFVSNKTNDSFNVQRSTVNEKGLSGFAESRITYNVKYTLENNVNGTTIKYQPTGYNSYQGGLIGSFAVPNFTEQDLTNYLIDQPVYYNLEIDSQYNSESTYSNFVRLTEKSQFRQGEKDPVTGKIFKDKFSIPYNNGKVYFTIETFPYRNGSKVVLHLIVRGSMTSENVVDYGIIFKEVKTLLENVANS